MKRFVLAPHLEGWGHRERCNTLGAAILAGSPETHVTILARRDDPIPATAWTPLPVTRSALGRTWAILRADVLVEDGFFFIGSRVRWMKRLGGKLVLVAQPTGFRGDSGVREAVETADSILVPWPREIYEPDPLLREVGAKVRVVRPITGVPRVVRDPPRDRVVVYCTISRPAPGTREAVEQAVGQLSRELGRPVVASGGFGAHLPPEEHVRAYREAHVIVTQGSTVALEALSLGIPIVMVPLPEAAEHRRVAERLAARGMARCLPQSELTPEALAQAILAALESESPSTTDGRRPQWGASEAVSALLSLAGLEAPPEGRTRPWLSVISTNYNCGHAIEAHLDSIYQQFREDEFEYVVVDNFSTDQSPELFRSWAVDHPNFRWLQRRSTMGLGRELAARASRGSFLLAVDTDTVYFPALRPFVDRATTDYAQYAVQAIYAGVFPRSLWRAVGGRANFNAGEDFEMWMRIWRLGRMRWYPVRMGENMKEPGTSDGMDFRSTRYTKADRLRRLLRTGFDRLQLMRFERSDLERIWRGNSIDLGLGPLEPTWFGHRRPRPMPQRFETALRHALTLLREPWR